MLIHNLYPSLSFTGSCDFKLRAVQQCGYVYRRHIDFYRVTLKSWSVQKLVIFTPHLFVIDYWRTLGHQIYVIYVGHVATYIISIGKSVSSEGWPQYSYLQDLVCKTFYEFWFDEPSGVQTQYFGDGSSVPLEVSKKTKQIVDVAKGMTNHQLLVVIIKRNLALDFFPQSAKAAGINPVSLAAVRRRCELMCKCLLEQILQVFFLAF